MAAVIARQGATNTVGISMSARRCGDRTAIIDEFGALTFRQLDDRANALAAGLQKLTKSAPQAVAIMCRNHRGFVEAIAAADRIGADVLLLNTAFAGPALAEVVVREKPGVVIYDDEFEDSVHRAIAGTPDVQRIVATFDGRSADFPTVIGLIAGNEGRRPRKAKRKGKLILLTSGTTGTPKGARRSGGGGAGELSAVVSRVPWRAEETTVVAAPMFHAWGYGQMVMCALMSCTMVIRRKFDPEGTLALIDRHRATGLSVCR
jgi:fatty-acyl-CoA synthase